MENNIQVGLIILWDHERIIHFYIQDLMLLKEPGGGSLVH
jgi:hypothetical protein